MPPSPIPIDLSKLELVLEQSFAEQDCNAPGDELDRDSDSDELEDTENEFAFTKEYKFTVADPDPPEAMTEQDQVDTEDDESSLSATDLLLRRLRQSLPSFVPPQQPLVHLQVRTIDRNRIPPGAFHVYMDNVCEVNHTMYLLALPVAQRQSFQDFLQFSVAVFSKDGRINDQLVSPCSSHKGTGVWGSEINHGKLAYIENFRVHPKYQRKGVGRWAIESLLKNPLLADCPFIFTWAMAPNSSSILDLAASPPHPDVSSKKNGVISFWRALGFRRVGGTWFFGYARDPQHPMRSLPAADDADATQVKGTSSEDVIMQYNSC